VKRRFSKTISLKTILLAWAILPVLSSLQGCVVVAAGAGAATGASIAHDRRSAGTVLDDQIIEFKAISSLQKDEDLWKKTHINVTAFNNVLLLSGEVPNDFLRTRAGGLVSRVPKVRAVHNDLHVSLPTPMSSRSNDSWITTKVKSKLLADRTIDPTRIKVVTERGIVYLMGLVTRHEANIATEITRRVTGVRRVIKLFEYI